MTKSFKLSLIGLLIILVAIAVNGQDSRVSFNGIGFQKFYKAGDIRNYGAICNGSDQFTAFTAALTAGLTYIYIPANCSVILPTGLWTYTRATDSVTVPVPVQTDSSGSAITAGVIPGGIMVEGEDWMTSIIQSPSPTSQPLFLGPSSIVKNVNYKNLYCSNQDASGAFAAGGDCPMRWIENSWPMTHGTLSTSGTSVTWVSGDKFEQETGTANSWIRNSNTYPGLYLIINGTQYTVSSVASSTSMTLNSSAGTQFSVPYTAYFWRVNPGFGYTSMNVQVPGSHDSNGIHVDGFGGDTIYASAHGSAGAAFRGAIYERGNRVFLAERHNDGAAFEAFDAAGPIGYPMLFLHTSYMTGSDVNRWDQDTTTFTGNFLTIQAANGSGVFSGNFIDMKYNGTSRFKFTSAGSIIAPSLPGGSGGVSLCVDGSGNIYKGAPGC